jgi:enamine deaminase RidA (YjgF/YER057c/UK114 family)
MSDVVRGPSPGAGRSAWVAYNGIVWTNGFPKGKQPDDDVAEQTRKALACLDQRLAEARATIPAIFCVPRFFLTSPTCSGTLPRSFIFHIEL